MRNLNNILKNGAQDYYKKRFENKVKQLIEYLLLNWQDSVADDFKIKLYQTIELLSEQPNLGLKVKSFAYTRTILITAHNRLYYRVENNTLVITNLIDTRCDPKKNPFNKTK